MSLTTEAIKHVMEIDAQVESLIGWDSGVGAWNLHAHEEDYSDLIPMKMGGSEHLDLHPMEVVQQLQRTAPPACTVGLIMSWEAWHSPSGYTPATEAPDRTDIRYVVCALRSGPVVLLEHLRDTKPTVRLMDPMRCLTSPAAGDVCASLHDLLTSPTHSDSNPLTDFLQKLLGDSGGGFIIMGGPDA